ncbi:MFS general substrate transporter [Aaosphaeria arxii CBS 175.79]|uniref:MFS general substrate transporter n=1 Tax=Aaosphaeria arxii CBS 175.79 TaxID=1450172 RepID=A0A6A5YAZ5_9PLEO|nr:MFS general substrate transporter [Aaosphaeria arxii CBS 175.79]KAF2022406.1 MFS general substrate transporter [Aaosphaeria arxii CBS 175.79]
MAKEAKHAESETISAEHYENVSDGGETGMKKIQQPKAIGTVTITDMKDIFLVPSPSADPRVSSLSLSLVSGFGGLLGFYIPQYAEKGATYADITALMTYPSMFMGIGNLICMPLALAIGRRPVFLGSLLLLIAGAVAAAYAKDYNTHLGMRMLLGLAAGQSEALVPMMIQEIHFVHERSTFLMWQSAVQTTLAAVYTIFASPIAQAIGPGNWYILGAGLCAVTFLVSIPFVPESRYDRSLAAYGQFSREEGGEGNESRETAAAPVKLTDRPALDTTRYKPRTVWSDMQLMVGKADWREGYYGFINTFQILLFPNVFWAFCLNGLTIGVNIAIGTTYAGLVAAPPYNWPDSSASYVNAGQIVVAFVALPLLGNGSDFIIKWRARRNGGVHEPENRLLLLWIPLIVGVLASNLYGQAGSHPGDYHWFVFVFANAGYYFAFVGANIAAITYLLDSYPTRSGPVLVVITAFRGFVSFGVSYGVSKFIDNAGYDGSFGTYAGLTALLGLLGIPIFIYGKRIRTFTGRYATKEKTGHPSMSH